MKIAIISDTHNLLRPELAAHLKGCDRILHAGDISSQKVLVQLQDFAPVTVVRGNNDKEWAEGLPETLAFTLGKLRVFMVHNKKQIPAEVKDAGRTDLIIYGHSHKYEDRQEKGVRYLNPGSCGPRRLGQEITFAMMSLKEDGSFAIEKILIPNQAGKGATDAQGEVAIPANIRDMIPDIMREIDADKSIRQIARKHKIPEVLAEQITRMYLTHPGVDVDGIMRRIGL